MQISRHGSTSLLSQSSVGLKDIEHPSSLLPIRVQARVIVGGRRFRCESRDCGEFMSPWVESGPGRPLLPEG
jgi:hypothetical protein